MHILNFQNTFFIWECDLILGKAIFAKTPFCESWMRSKSWQDFHSELSQRTKIELMNNPKIQFAGDPVEMEKVDGVSNEIMNEIKILTRNRDITFLARIGTLTNCRPFVSGLLFLGIDSATGSQSQSGEACGAHRG